LFLQLNLGIRVQGNKSLTGLLHAGGKGIEWQGKFYNGFLPILTAPALLDGADKNGVARSGLPDFTAHECPLQSGKKVPAY